MKILVTGGLGFIGSHTVVELLQHGHEVLIVDDLSNSKIEVLERIEQITGKHPEFYQLDVTNKSAIEPLFKRYGFEGILHFAGFKAVGESVREPLKYYRNNLFSTIHLCELATAYDVKRFVFSSSATVYGSQASPLKETLPLQVTSNPYGETKAMSERILTDLSKVQPCMHISLLRYFNPIGAHPSGLIGEDPQGIPNNLMPYISKVASGELSKLSVFGNDYDTVDGTGVRDYIHVVDLAKGHLRALESVKEGLNIYNLGTGKGTSVLELVHAFEEENGIDIPLEIVDRRPGDLATTYAEVSKIEEELGWRAERSIRDMVRDAWNYEQRQHQ